jgi:hypothetical protein
MILEARLRDDVYISIDAVPSSGISKGGSERGYPDQALDNMLKLASQVTSRLHEITEGDKAPDELEVRFGIKVDGDAIVSVSRDITTAQFQVTARWNQS